MPTPREHLLDELHARLGYRRMSLVWAKVEIILGLLAAIVGLALVMGAVHQPLADLPWSLAAAGVVLFVLGGYLTLAGHRSHLYKAASERMALLVEEIRRTGNDTVVSAQHR
jgi:protein-S-isoprenylcysteine O-methyltransferase Ste14